MINGLRVTGANVSSKAAREANGWASGRYSRSINMSEKKKMKKVQYNMRQISSRVLKSKTSNSARMAWTGAKSTVSQLKRKLYSGEYDKYDLEHAIIHAMRIVRAAKKKMKHLQEEETAKKGGLCSASLPDEDEKLSEYNLGNDGDFMLEMERDMQERMQRKLQEEIQKIVQEINEIMQEDIYEELSSSKADIDPNDLEAMKKKHRSQELKDIIEADMKYLKAMFDKLQIQRQQELGASGTFGASGISGASNAPSPYGQSVSLEIGGVKLPVEEAPLTDVTVRSEGTSVDVQA